MGFDWVVYFYPWITTLLKGQNPYLKFGLDLVYPPWTLWMIAPFGLVPPLWGFIAVNVILEAGLIALCFKARQPRLAIPLAVSFPVMVAIWHGQVDGLVLWGLLIKGPIGLILLASKPQVAGLVGLLWVAQAWRAGRWRAVFTLVAPTALMVIVGTALYPQWLFGAQDQVRLGRVLNYNTTGFPWFMPVGLALFVGAFKANREDWAALANIMIAPYASPQSWIAAYVLLSLNYPLEGLIASLSSWAIPAYLLLTRSG